MTAEGSSSSLVSDLGLNSDIVLQEKFQSDLAALKTKLGNVQCFNEKLDAVKTGRVFLLYEIMDLEILHKAAQLQHSPIKGGSNENQSKEMFQKWIECGAESFGVEFSPLAIGGITADATVSQAFALWNHWRCDEWMLDIAKEAIFDPYARLWLMSLSRDKVELIAVMSCV
uniref:Uncharacterized protein n=1 Tax=Cryptomonas curvata TaxID=233186 RepID=A0A7S0QDI9_9CRYP